MAKRNPVLLEAALLVLAVGFVLFLNPFENEPLWAQWLAGPVMIYLALPVSMVAAAVYFFRPSASPAPPKVPTKARG
jgi:hypothetical protein